MNAALRPSVHAIELIDVEVECPAVGAHVYGMGAGGSLVPLWWNENSHLYYWAWMPYPVVPQSVKARIAAQFAPRVNAVNPEE